MRLANLAIEGFHDLSLTRKTSGVTRKPRSKRTKKLDALSAGLEKVSA